MSVDQKHHFDWLFSQPLEFLASSLKWTHGQIVVYIRADTFRSPWAFGMVPSGILHTGPVTSPRDMLLVATSDEALGSEMSKPLAKSLCGPTLLLCVGAPGYQLSIRGPSSAGPSCRLPSAAFYARGVPGRGPVLMSRMSVRVLMIKANEMRYFSVLFGKQLHMFRQIYCPSSGVLILYSQQ
jgi:hypothetical protein